MSLRAGWLLAVLLLPGCLEYEITVETTVQADGKVHRALTISESEQKTWKRFQPPAAPYVLEGSEEKGFSAVAEFGPGRHASGIRVLLTDPEGDYGGAEKARDLPAAVGTLHVQVTDLMFGTLYAYREKVALGADPARFRRELPRWLDVGLRLLLEALKLKLPEVDFTDVEKNARAGLIQRVEYSFVSIYQAASALTRDYRRHRYGEDVGLWLENPHAQLILAEMAVMGLHRRADAGRAKTLQQFVEGGWTLGGGIVDEFVAPLPKATRERVKAILLHMNDELEKEFEQAFGRVFADKAARPRIQADFLRFAVAAVGAYVAHGLLDEHELSFRLKMPGRLLRTNGSLGRLPEVEWRLGDDDLALVAPQLSAYSFVPARGVEHRAWQLDLLLDVRQKLAALDEDGRKVLGEIVKVGWTATRDEIREAHGDAIAKAYTAMQEALD
ncbi:MAG: hypothetical protein ACYTEZ_16825 [Planctomycetota bacterium]|jgi:hypothetical protein